MFWTIYSIAFLVWIYNCLLVTVYKPKLVVDNIELSFKFVPKYACKKFVLCLSYFWLKMYD
jgi:hypothetical protein